MSRSSKPPTQPTAAQKPVNVAWKDRIPEEDYNSLKETFDVFDEDHSGTIDPQEINKVLEEIGLKSNPFVHQIIEALKDRNKPLKFQEFLEIVVTKVGDTKTKDGLRRHFAIYDQNQDDLIDFQELKHIAKVIHDPINDEELLELMHSTFINNKTQSNEGFNFQEFYAVVSKVNLLK